MFLNRKYIYPIALFLLLLISCQQGDSDKLNIDSNTITGEVVPNDSLHPPIISNLREPVGKGYNNPTLIPRINNAKPIKPSQRFEISLSSSTQLSPGASNYPVSSKLTSKPTLMKSPWAGEVTRSKNTDGQALLLSEKDGLSFVTDAIVQGPESAIWGCSKWLGIWKYDGYQFFHFDKSTGLADPSVSNLFFDSDDDLWIGMSSGLAKFDGTHITHYTGENEASRNKPSRLTEDNNGNIWVGAKDGLSCINKKGNTIRHFTTEQGLSQNDISSLIADHLGRIWITYNFGGYSILTIQHNPNKLEYQINNYESNPSFNLYLVQQLLETKDNRMCILTNRSLIQIDNTLPDGKNMSAILYTNIDTGTKFNAGIAEDHAGRIWLASNEKVLALESVQSKDLNYITHTDYTNLSPGAFVSILVDQDNFLWLARRLQDQSHLNRIQIDNPFFSIKKEFGVSCFAHGPLEDKWGNIWFYCSHQGLFCNRKSKSGIHDELLIYPRANFDNISFPRGMILDSNNNIWLNSASTLLKVELFKQGDSIQVKEYGEEEGFLKKSIQYLLADQQGKIWVTENTLSPTDRSANSTGGAVYKLDGNRLHKYGTKQGLLTSDTYGIDQDKDGNFWFSSLHHGLTRFEPNHSIGGLGRWTHFNEGFQENSYGIFSSPFSGIMTYSPTLKTIFHLSSTEDPETLQIKDWANKFLYKRSDEKVTMGNSILTQDNEIWLGHKKGLARLSQAEFDRPGKSPLEFYTLLDGYSNESVRKIIEDSDGMLWSVGNKDVIGINKERIEQNNAKPKTHLRKLIQSDQVYQLNHKPDLKFSYQENYIGFEFNAIEVNKSHKLEYRHQLLGYESNWSNPSITTSTFYPNLPHGSYTFEVASRLVNGEWGEPAQYSFRITPPWWESKIAYIIYITLGLLAMTWIWRDQLNRIRVKNQIEKELLEAEKIREIDEVKTRFFTNMSHEYRTPLTVILGMTEELKEDNLAKKLIKQSGQNLLRLVNQMLDFSKLEDGRLVLNLKQGEFVSYLQYLLESFQSLAEHKNITLHFESSIKALHMPFDEDKIQHIISNLLSNAIKFTPSNGHVYLQLSEVSNQLSIKVKDTGVGIPSGDIQHIFERFFQIKNDLSEGQAGTGIGLSFTKELVEMMKGSISVESELDKGTAFTVLLPIAQNAAQIPYSNETEILKRKVSYEGIYKSPEKEIDQDALQSESVATQKPQLLLVEDNPEVVAYMENVLKSDFDITIAIDGKIGIEKAIDLIPDIIISDVMMPFKNGYEVTSTIKKDERTSHIPIIMLTAKVDQDSKIEGLESGADAYLAKPFNKKELKIRLRNMIELSRKYQKKYSNAATLPAIPASTEKSPNKVVDPENAFLQKVNILIDKNLDNGGFLVDELSKEVGMNRSQLYRKLKALTGKSTVAYLRSRRLHEAQRLLKKGDLNVSEVGYEVGFTSPSYFSKAFSDEFGYSPTEVKNKKNEKS